MGIHFKTVERSDLDYVNDCRNMQMEMLRTPFMLTTEMQEEFYSRLNKRDSNCRFFSVYESGLNILIGMTGLENIQWENRLAEISLITSPDCVDYIPEIFFEIMRYAFWSLNLHSIFTEVYECSPHVEIWKTIGKDHCANISAIPHRKYHGGRYYDSKIYTFVAGKSL